MHRSLIYRLQKRRFKLEGIFGGSGKTPPPSASNGIRIGSISTMCPIQRVNKPFPCPAVFINYIHTTARLRSDFRDDSENEVSKSTKRKKNSRLKQDEEELHSAAVDAAKSLPGDWNRIAEDLMSRLAIQGPSKDAEDVEKDQPAVSSSLLSTMRVSKNFEGTEKMSRKRESPRKIDKFGELYSQPRLGIFDPAKFKAEAGKMPTEDENDLWQVVSKERVVRERGGMPKNGFEETIQWTKEGRMWTFPINNEEDMHEERQYKFHEHVFLSHHLGDFPTEGPIRRFMDLVVIGLSKNPWISVSEKIEHIHWYADYFRQKQQLLESSIGEKAIMKQSS